MPKPQDMTILVVDDEPGVVIYLKTLLEDAGFTVVTAADGNEALDHVKRRKPDLISLDLVMPKKSGIRFFYELRHNKEWARIPVVIVTAHAHDDKMEKDIHDLFAERTMVGPRTYLEKPVKPKNYVDLVKKELGISIIEEEPEAGALEMEQMRKRAHELLNESSPETIREALELMSKRESQAKKAKRD
jgi:CheY-like chemotaxis protein